MPLKTSCGLDLPSLFDISELCNPGSSAAILRRWMRDQTMKAFMGRFTLSAPTDISPFFKNPLFARKLLLADCRNCVSRRSYIRANFRRCTGGSCLLHVVLYLCDRRRGDAYCRFPCFSSHGRAHVSASLFVSLPSPLAYYEHCPSARKKLFPNWIKVISRSFRLIF